MTVFFEFLVACTIWQWLGFFVPFAMFCAGLFSVAGAMADRMCNGRMVQNIVNKVEQK